MKGIIVKTKDSCVIEYETGTVPLKVTLAIHPDDIAQVEAGQLVEFMIVDEFTHPQLFYNVGWGDGIICGKIIS
jgi:hypothetical protein